MRNYYTLIKIDRDIFGREISSREISNSDRVPLSELVQMKNELEIAKSRDVFATYSYEIREKCDYSEEEAIGAAVGLGLVTLGYGTYKAAKALFGSKKK
jgi:hypothetical protein